MTEKQIKLLEMLIKANGDCNVIYSTLRKNWRTVHYDGKTFCKHCLFKKIDKNFICMTDNFLLKYAQNVYLKIKAETIIKNMGESNEKNID